MKNGLTSFHPLINQWFSEKYGRPTDVQTRVWEDFHSGDHFILSSPTGSGKTLGTAADFLGGYELITNNELPYYKKRKVKIIESLTSKEYEISVSFPKEAVSNLTDNSRIRELAPRLSWDKIDDSITAKPGSFIILYMSGGTIPDRGYYTIC